MERKMADRVLVVDDKEGIRDFISGTLQKAGISVNTAVDGMDALATLERQSFHLMITDLKMPRMDGMALFKKARELDPEMEVIVLTAYGTVDTAVEAMKLGAFEYLSKPLESPAELRLIVERALERRRLLDSRRHHHRTEGKDRIVTENEAMLEILHMVEKVSATNSAVLLLGESGTGKEIFAREIHKRSQRADEPFVAVNCAAISEQLIESEMFGHEQGAFTGAIDRRRGRFELADKGTLFLDEVAELTPKLQAKLLRVIQESCFERVGGTRNISVDVRLITATNRDLKAEIDSGRFREDLYHRLSVFPLLLPPLRARVDDMQPLTEYLLGKIGRKVGRSDLALDGQALEALKRYNWPGNVRELQNVLERACILSDGPKITVDQLLFGVGDKPPEALEAVTLRDAEKEVIRKALLATHGNRKKCAERLGISLRTFYNKLK
jgi:two-component system response regulator FlrC